MKLCLNREKMKIQNNVLYFVKIIKKLEKEILNMVGNREYYSKQHRDLKLITNLNKLEKGLLMNRITKKVAMKMKKKKRKMRIFPSRIKGDLQRKRKLDLQKVNKIMDSRVKELHLRQLQIITLKIISPCLINLQICKQ